MRKLLFQIITSIKADMGKKHDTFPEEQPEMPVPKERPEITEPADPKMPEIPQEDPQQFPDELPPSDLPKEEPRVI